VPFRFVLGQASLAHLGERSSPYYKKGRPTIKVGTTEVGGTERVKTGRMTDIVTRPIRPAELGFAAELRERMTREIQGDEADLDPHMRERFVDFYRTRLAAGT
jgi:hypothetical protein